MLILQGHHTCVIAYFETMIYTKLINTYLHLNQNTFPLYRFNIKVNIKVYNKFHHSPSLAFQMEELNQIQQLYNKIPKQVIGKFTTKLADFQVDVSEVDLPTQMDEAECNKLIKQLLQSSNLSNLDAVQFQFLVGGKLLRGQLKSHIIRYEISCEQTLDIEYFLAFQPLQNQKTIPQDDWISTLTIISHPTRNLIAAGLFSGAATIFSNKNKQILKLQLDQDCIKSIKILATEQQNSYYLISGGVNQQIRIGNLSVINENKASFEPLSTTQHQGSILGIDTNPLDDGHFCTVSNSGFVSVYKIPQNFLTSDQQFNQAKKNKKKRHLNEKSILTIATESVHNDAINCVNWITEDRIVTGSADHSIKLLDVQKMRQVGTVFTKDSITTSIDYTSDRLLTSHQDGYIRLWDVRAPQIPSHTFKAHSKLVNSVKFNSRSYLFASGSYDTTVKIWDYRSSFPIQSMGTHHDKVFSVAWKHEQQLVAGGADSKISIHGV